MILMHPSQLHFLLSMLHSAIPIPTKHAHSLSPQHPIPYTARLPPLHVLPLLHLPLSLLLARASQFQCARRQSLMALLWRLGVVIDLLLVN